MKLKRHLKPITEDEIEEIEEIEEILLQTETDLLELKRRNKSYES